MNWTPYFVWFNNHWYNNVKENNEMDPYFEWFKNHWYSKCKRKQWSELTCLKVSLYKIKECDDFYFKFCHIPRI